MNLKQKETFIYKNKNGEIQEKYYTDYLEKHFNPIDCYFRNGDRESFYYIPKNGDMMLYNYEKLLKAIKNKEDIYLLGNEYDVDFLEEQINITATTFAHRVLKMEELDKFCSVFKGATLYITTEWLTNLVEYNQFKKDIVHIDDGVIVPNTYSEKYCYSILLEELYRYADKCYMLPVGERFFQDVNYYMCEECPWYVHDLCRPQKIAEMFEKLKSKKYELDGINFVLNKFQPNEEDERRPMFNPWHRWWEPKINYAD